jgi:opacity protein-like surface antigen
MNQKTKLKFLISAAAVSLGLALSAAAQTADVAVPAAGWGLLGTNYSSLTYRYTDLDNGPPSALRGAGVEFNQAWQPGFDFTLGYDWARASAGSLRLTSQDLNAGVTAYTKLEWGKPFVQALAGWEWRRGGGASDSSFAYTLGTGVEFQVAQAFVVTPYLNFVRATAFNRSEGDLGVKGTYLLNRQWSLTAGVEYQAISHAKDSTQYSLGVNYHY